jgi:hypothetical protein
MNKEVVRLKPLTKRELLELLADYDDDMPMYTYDSYNGVYSPIFGVMTTRYDEYNANSKKILVLK